jgi:2-oxoglutarate dehydrogenase complex dehydrogenase (E1) component-like enzyme
MRQQLKISSTISSSKRLVGDSLRLSQNLGMRWKLSFRHLFSTVSRNNDKDIEISLKLSKVIRAFRTRGHFSAKLNPLAYLEKEKIDSSKNLLCWNYDTADNTLPNLIEMLSRNEKKYIDLAAFNIQNIDIDKLYYLGDEIKVKDKSYWTIKELLTSLKDTYCGSVGIEYTHIENDEELSWLESKIEGYYGPRKWSSLPKEEKKSILGKFRCSLIIKIIFINLSVI